MGRFKKSDNLDQALLLPLSMRDWLPEEHLAWFVMEIVDQLDLDPILDSYRECGKGEHAFPPAVMLRLLIYGYATGVISSRKIARAIEENIAFRVLAAGHSPNHRTICRFRERHLSHFLEIFVQVVQLAQEAGLVKMGLLAIDGSKIKANASRHKAMSYERMQKDEERLKQEIAEIAEAARKKDELEDGKYGPHFRGDELPDELKRRESRLARIQAAKKTLEERKATEHAQATEGQPTEDTSNKKRGRPRKYERDKPKPKDQWNFTDPESRIMSHGKGRYEQSYNAQIAVDEEKQIIVGADVTQCSADYGSLVPMIKAAEQSTGKTPEAAVADAGYKSEDNFVELANSKTTAYVALGREGKAGSKPINEEHVETIRMDARLRSEHGREIYRKRKWIVESPFGWIKNVLGIRTFSLRGHDKVSGEWLLICLSVNMRRMNGKLA